MHLRNPLLVFIIFILVADLIAQETNYKFVGVYSDHKKYPIEILKLKSDGTFIYTHSDPYWPFTIEEYTNTGNWITENNLLILNPDKKARKIKTTIIEKKKVDNDSIAIKVNFKIREFENEKLSGEGVLDLVEFILYLNGKRYYISRQKQKKSRIYGRNWGKQFLIDSSNVIWIPKSKINSIKSIGFWSVQFNQSIEFNELKEGTNYFEINIGLDMDKNREPRQKKVKIKGRRAYLNEYNGKLDTSIFALKLKKRKKVAKYKDLQTR